jgi:hypothetical protein
MAADQPDTKLGASQTTGQHGFVVHLLEAIALNASRARTYARQSQGRSWWLSCRLITVETLLIPVAWSFDLWGGSFQAKGMPAVAGDFASMQAAAASDRPLSPIRQPQPAVWRDLADDLAFYGQVIQRATEARDFRLVCQACDALLDSADRLQTSHGLPLPMTRHVLESVGYGAVHALELQDRSAGATDGLYASFLGLQAMGLQPGLDFDRAALPVQADGVGFLVNDLPPIPFREAWAAYRRANPGR